MGTNGGKKMYSIFQPIHTIETSARSHGTIMEECRSHFQDLLIHAISVHQILPGLSSMKLGALGLVIDMDEFQMGGVVYR